MGKFVAIGNIAKDENDEFCGPAFFSAVTAKKMMHWDSTIISKGMNLDKIAEELRKFGVNFIGSRAWCDCKISGERIISHPGKILEVPSMKADVFHIAPLINEIDPKIMKKLERDEETLISLDAEGFTKTNVDGVIKRVPWLEKEEFLQYVDILKLDSTDLYYLTGKATINSAMNLLKMGPKVVILTMGEKGGYVFYGNMKYMKIPIYETTVKSTLAVGDVFATAFVTRYWETKDLQGATYFASAAASLLIEKGGVKGIQDKEKVKKRYRTLREIFLGI